MSFALPNSTPSLFRPVLGRNAPAPAAPISDADADAQAAINGADADAALVQKAATGDVQAFRVLVERYQKPMASLVSRMTVSTSGHHAASDVDDIVQELFIRAWKGLPKFRHDAQFSTWLYRIAVNTTIKHRTRHKNEAAQSVSADSFAGGFDGLPLAGGGNGPTSGDDPYVVTAKKERDEALRRAVAALPEKQRVVVVLHYFEGHSCEDISRIVGCSLGTVWSRLHYACKRLKGVVEPVEGTV